MGKKLLCKVTSDTLFVSMGYHTDQQETNRLHVQGKIPVIPPKRKRCNPRADDRDLYKARQRNIKLSIPTEVISGDYRWSSL